MDVLTMRRHVFTSVVWILSVWLNEAAAECNKMQVKDTTYQSSREGTYSPSGDTCNNRLVYRKSGSTDNFIYFIETVDGWRGWMIGSTSCTNKGGMAAESEAHTPDQITTRWEEVYSGSWWYTPAQVACADITVGAIVGIVVAILIVLVLIVVTIYCCCKSSGNKNRTNNTPGDSTGTTGVTTHVATVSHTNQSYSYGPYPHHAAASPPTAWAAPGAPPQAPPYTPGYNAPPPAYSELAADPAYPPGAGPNTTAPPPPAATSPPPPYAPEGPK